MTKFLRLTFIFVFIIAMFFTFNACSASGKLVSIEIDASSLEEYYDLSSFSISKINIILTYENENSEVVPLSLNMIKAEDHPKLQVVGDHTITVMHRQRATVFTLRLRDIIDKFIVRFLNEDGTQLGETQFIEPNGTARPPIVPPKADHIFDGWVDQRGNYSYYDNIQEDKIFTAVFAPDYYTVRFILETGGTIDIIRIRRGDSAASVAPDFPVIPGKTAIGWDKDLNAITADTTIQALYVEETINVLFVYGNDGRAPRELNYSVYTNIDSPPDPQVNHAQFLGWYTNSAFKGPAVTFPYLVTNEITFYAKYVSRTEGSDGLIFSETGDNTYTISKYEGNDDIIVIPEQYNNCDVVGVDNKAFLDCNNSRFYVTGTNRHFAINDGVLFDKSKETLIAYPPGKTENTYIFPSGVKRVENYAFANAKNLLLIRFQDDTLASNSLTSIGDYAFYNCIGLMNINVPSSVKLIGDYAFCMVDLSQLTSFTFGEESELEEIGDRAFNGLRGLTEIKLPSTKLRTIGRQVFDGCLDLSEISLDVGEVGSYFRTVNGVLYDYGLNTLVAYPPNNIKNNTAYFTVFDDITTIKAGAFSNANVIGVILPSSIDEIEANAFDSAKLQYIQFKGDQQPNEINEIVFGLDFQPAFVIVPQERQEYFPFFEGLNMQFVEDAPDTIYYYNSTTGYLYTRNEASSINILGLRKPTSELIIPSQIENLDIVSIGKYAFYNNQTISSVTLSEGIIEIGEFAFSNSKRLNEITLPSSLKSIRSGAFSDCLVLKTINAPGDIVLEGFGDDVFYSTPWYEYPEDKLLLIGDVLIKFNDDVSSVELEDIRIIADSAFMDKKNLRHITLNVGLQKIRNKAFYNCTSLVYIEIPETVDEIGDYAFAFCSSLFRIIMKSKSPPALSPTAFYTDAVYSISNEEYGFSIGIPYHGNDDYLTNYENKAIWEEYKSYFVHIDESHIAFSSKSSYLGYVANTIYEPPLPDSRADEVFGGWYFVNDSTTQFTTDPVVFPLQIEEGGLMLELYARWFNENEGVSGIEYRSIKNGTEYAVSNYSGDLNFVVIPKEYKGKPVTTILKDAFINKDDIYNITLPTTITTIEEGAFDNTRWYNQFLGDFVYINDILIKYTGNARNVEIPPFIKIIVAGAFRENIDINTVRFPSEIEIIPAELMYKCSNLEQITLPENLIEIQEKAFMNCAKLNFGEFPYSVEKIASDALLNTYWFNNFIDDIVRVNDILYKYKGEGQYKQTTLHIPNTIYKIGERAFEGNENLEHIYIADTITIIEESAFEGCIAIKEVVFAQYSRIKIIETNAFAGCISLRNFNMGDNHIEEIGDYAFAECNRLESAELPATLIYLGEGAYSTSGIKSAHFANNSQLSQINKNTFANCVNLIAFSFGDNGFIENIASGAFYECTSLRSVIIPVSNRLLVTIQAEVFYGCRKLTNIVLPTSLMEIGDNAFTNVPYVESSTEPLMTVGSVLLRYRGSNTEIVISNEIAAISKEAFKDNASIKKIIFEENSQLFAIGEEAFANCVNLEDINFPLSITYVGKDAFHNTKWFDRYIDDFVVINDILIKYRGDDYQAIIPDNVTAVGIEAFEGNQKLRNIVVSKNVNRIMARAFDNMSPSSTITMLPVNPPQLDEDNDIQSLSVIYVEDNRVFNNYSEDETWSMYVNDAQKSIIVKHKITLDLVRFTDNFPDIETNVLFEEPTPYKDGYTFIGWFEIYHQDYGPNAPGAYENLVSLPYSLTGDITLYAKWLDNQEGTTLGDFWITHIDTSEDNYITQYDGPDRYVMIPATYAEEIIVGISKRQATDPNTGLPLEDEHGAPIFDRFAFYNNTYIEEIVFVENSQIRFIMDGAFENCTNLRRIVLPSTIEYIGKNAFANCTSLEEIVFIGGGTSNLHIDANAFYGCVSLEAITFEKNLRSIGLNAFRNCTSLSKIYLKGDSPPVITDRPFETHEGLKIYVNKTIDNSVLNDYIGSWPEYEDYITDEED